MNTVSLQTYRRPRQPVPGEHRDEAAGAGHPAVHRQARDPARVGLLRQPVRLLPRPGRQPANPTRRERKATAQREVRVFLSVWYIET